MGVEWTSDGRPQGPTHRILSPLAPTIGRIGPHSPCIVGAGEDVDVGMGPLWLPVRAPHHISSPYLKGIGPCGCPSVLFSLFAIIAPCGCQVAPQYFIKYSSRWNGMSNLTG